MNDSIITRYRVLATTTTGFVDPKVDTRVEWEGTDTDALSRTYPPSVVMGADRLSRQELDDGVIRTRFTFEKQRSDGTWEKIKDPRRRLNPITEHEYQFLEEEVEIDQENRRRFPGDYEDVDDADCEACGDRGCLDCLPIDERELEIQQERRMFPADFIDVVCDACLDRGCPKCDSSIVYCADCTELADGDDGLCSDCRDERDWRYERDWECAGCDKHYRAAGDTLCASCRKRKDDDEAYWYEVEFRMRYGY